MRKTKVLSLLLVVSLLVTLLAGCGEKTEETKGGAENKEDSAQVESISEKDMVTVKAALLSAYDMTDAPMVQDAMNEILAERYGIQCELTFIGLGSWREQSNLLLTGDDVDVMTFFLFPLNSFVSNGQCLPLDDYVANASDAFKSIFTEEQMKGCQINGIQYAIPNLRNYGNNIIVNFDETKLAELGYKTEDIKTMEDVEEVLYAAHKAYPDIYTVVPQINAVFSQVWTWDGLGDENWIGVLGNCGQDTAVTDIFECQDFIDLCTRTHQWYLDGLIMGDALSNQEVGNVMVQNGAAFATFGNSSNAAPAAGLAQSVIYPNWTYGASISSLTFGINSLSSHSDEAWTLLQALYTDTDLMTLLINGIEGVHYVMNEDGSCSYPEGVESTTSTYGNALLYWGMPYAKGVPPIDELGSADFFDELIAFNNESTISKAAGFVLDTEAMGIVDEYAACLNVKDKYYNGLMNGVLDPAVVLPKAHQEMVDAGIEKVVAAKQAALDELLKK